MPPGVAMYLGARDRGRRRADHVPRRAAAPAPFPDGDQLALLRRAPAVRRLRHVQRLRLPEQRQGLAGGDDAAQGAAERPLPAALQRAGRRARRTTAATSARVRYVDADGALQSATADAFMLAASPIESARLCLLSEQGARQLERPGRTQPDVPLPDATSTASCPSASTASAAARSRTASPTSAASSPAAKRSASSHDRRTPRRPSRRHLRVQRFAGPADHRRRQGVRHRPAAAVRAPLRHRPEERACATAPSASTSSA